MACLVGKWRVCRELTTGYDEWHAAYGTPKADIEEGRNIDFTLEISRKDETWKQVLKIKAIPLFPITRVYSFKSGEPFTFKDFDEKTNMRSTIAVHDDKFTEVIGTQQSDGTYKDWDIVTEIEEDMLKITETYRDVVQITKLKRV